MTTFSRDIAFRVLIAHRDTGTQVAELIDEHAEDASRDDLRLASEIIFTSIRRRETLDVILAEHVRRPRDQVEQDLWLLLQIGVCQVVLLETPMHAAVHETVESARRVGNPRWTGFLNGTLRAVARTADKSRETAASWGPAHVPLRNGLFRVLDRPIFPDPATDPVGYLSLAYSFPSWLVGRWLARADQEAVVRWANWFNASPKLTLRTNSLKASREELLEKLRDENVVATAGSHPASINLGKRYSVSSLPDFDAGAFAVQDESAMAASTLLAPQAGDRVLDLCAGSGSKSCHLAALMNNSGSVSAIDSSEARLKRLVENTQRLGISIIEPTCLDAVRDAGSIGDDYDAVLVDVPCSNTGVLGKRPEVRWRLQETELSELAELQTQLLAAAVNATKAGGRIVYSTCSCEPEENELLVAEFLKNNDHVSLISEQSHAPGRPGDGAYQALLTRTQ